MHSGRGKASCVLVVRSGLDGVARRLPGAETAQKGCHAGEAVVLQHERRTGARPFLRSSAVGDDPGAGIKLTEAVFELCAGDRERARDVSLFISAADRTSTNTAVPASSAALASARSTRSTTSGYSVRQRPSVWEKALLSLRRVVGPAKSGPRRLAVRSQGATGSDRSSIYPAHSASYHPFSFHTRPSTVLLHQHPPASLRATA